MSVPCGNFPSNVTIRPLFPSAFFLVAFFLVLSLMFVMAALRPLQASDTEEQTELLLSAPILQAVRAHPQILSQNAKLCQSIYRLGLSRAEQRAQISAKLSGGKRLGNNFNSKSRDADRAALRGFKNSENKVFDLDVTLRYALWDWDRGDNRVASHELTYAVNQLELEIALSDQLKSLLFMSLRLNLYEQLLGLHRQIITDINPHIEAIEAQGAAGVIRMADVRRAKLLQLDAEIKLRRTENNRAQILRELDGLFGLQPEAARELLAVWLERRPADLPALVPDSSLAARSLALQTRAARHEREVIEAELYPSVDGVLEATLFDLRDYEDEYQMVGRLEFSMPLYDGGSNKARLAENNWRISELGAERNRVIQEKQNEEAFNRLNYDDHQAQLAALSDRLANARERLASMMALLGRSDISRFDIAQQMIELGSSVEEQVSTGLELETTRITGLHLTDRLADILNIRIGDKGC